MMRVGSLFSGIGGIELGFEREGFETVWFVEVDEYARAVLRKHWPKTVIYGDVTKIDWRDVPTVDILTEGFPCQDISNAGKRAGIKGSRSSFWRYYCDAIRVLRPRYAVIENVAALVNRGLDTVLADLAEIRYDAEWHCISASSVGAFHRRERIFIIAYPNSCRHIHGQIEEQSAKRGQYALSESESICFDASNTDNDDNRKKCKKSICKEVAYVSDSSCQGSQGQWSLEPCVGRVADGVPCRVDRIRCLGNAVVPQCAQVIAQAIREVETWESSLGRL